MKRLIAPLLLMFGAASVGHASSFDADAWVADLQQVRLAMSEQYANFEWLVFEREIDLTSLFNDTEQRLRGANSDGEAKVIMERLVRRFGDGHVQIRWPSASTAVANSTAEAAPAHPCLALGYNAIMRGQNLGPNIPGYQALPSNKSSNFPAGLIQAGSKTLGVVRIGLFSPKGFPELCESAWASLGLDATSTCDERCAEKLELVEYRRLSTDLASQIRELKSAGSSILVVDVTNNGGGSEWAEAVARMVGPAGLRSERRFAVRGQPWVDFWNSVLTKLDQADTAAKSSQLAEFRRQIENAKKQVSEPCSSEPFWSGRRPTCDWLVPAFYGTELLDAGDASALRSKPWGPAVFSPAQYDFDESVWQGPLVVLVDGGTGSAAEEFAAVLQDNAAAIIMGAPTVGAGCGHVTERHPTELSHSHGIFDLPDCARMRKDGSNEVGGIDPDILLGFRSTDGMHRKGLRTARMLPTAADAAIRLYRSSRRVIKNPR